MESREEGIADLAGTGEVTRRGHNTEKAGFVDQNPPARFEDRGNPRQLALNRGARIFSIRPPFPFGAPRRV